MTDEQKAVKETEKKDTVGDSDKGIQLKTPDVIEQANKAAERLERANAEKKELMAQEKLGGYTTAGQQPEKPKPDSPEEYAEKALSGELNDL